MSLIEIAALAVPRLAKPGAWRRAGLAATDSVPFSSQAGTVEDKVDAINELFAEARDELEFANEDAGTTYFDESAKAAREAVAKVLDRYQFLLKELSNEDKGKVQRSMGLKMEQLKAELAQLDTLHD